MLALLIRFLIWLALCTAVYYGAKYFHWSAWALPLFAFASLALFLRLASRNQK